MLFASFPPPSHLELFQQYSLPKKVFFSSLGVPLMVSQRNQVYGYLFSPGMTDILVPTLNAVNERGRECEQSIGGVSVRLGVPLVWRADF